MTAHLPAFALTVIFSSAALTASAIAEEPQETPIAYQEETDAQERIALSGKLRMLSQRVPSAACHLAAGIDANETGGQLAAGIAEFDQILDALEFGDEKLGIIGAETRGKTLAKVQDLRVVWTPLRQASEEVTNGKTSDENLRVILDQNMAVLDAAKLLVLELVGQYSNPFEMVQADAFLIDIAGRQRMLTQRMSKESCMLTTGTSTEGTAELLEASIGVFETTLQALLHGMPAAGINKPPTAEISAGLEDVAKLWNGVKPMLAAALDGSSLDAEHETQKFQGLNATMARMNEVVGMYTTAAKRES